MVSGISGGQSAGQSASVMWQKLMKKADTNQDGQLTSDELKSALKQTGNTDTSKLDEFFNKLDTDGNGSITESEFTSSMQNLRGPQGPPPGPPPPKPEEMFKEADTDSDGKVTKDELKTAMSKHGTVDDTKLDEVFTKLDQDQDGSITLAEFTSGLEKHHKDSSSTTKVSDAEKSSTKAQKLMQELPKTQGYDNRGENSQKLLRSFFELTA
jgi:Ca2+-binding EF-hand superfamily protein